MGFSFLWIMVLLRVLPLMPWCPLAWFPHLYSDCPWPYDVIDSLYTYIVVSSSTFSILKLDNIKDGNI